MCRYLVPVPSVMIGLSNNIRPMNMVWHKEVFLLTLTIL